MRSPRKGEGPVGMSEASNLLRKKKEIEGLQMNRRLVQQNSFVQNCIESGSRTEMQDPKECYLIGLEVIL